MLVRNDQLPGHVPAFFHVSHLERPLPDVSKSNAQDNNLPSLAINRASPLEKLLLFISLTCRS